MFIERLQVEEGFLDGLDLQFESGLNVLIGPRGTGKTSVIELIRFCLEVFGLTDRSQSHARELVGSILGTGRVTVTLNVDGERLRVSRVIGDDAPGVHHDYPLPVILSQNEIELVGLDSTGRLRIIDGFRTKKSRNSAGEIEILSRIKSLTVEIQGAVSEIQGISDRISSLAGMPKELAESQVAEQTVLSTIAKTKAEQEWLTAIGKRSAALSVQKSIISRTLAIIGSYRQKLAEQLLAAPKIEAWPPAAESQDPLVPIRSDVENAKQALRAAIGSLDAGAEKLGALSRSNNSDQVAAEDQARDLRRRLESLKEGAGAATRKVAELREKVSQLSALKSLYDERMSQLTTTQQDRINLLNELETLREMRFKERQATVKALNNELGPRIQVALEKSALHSEYTSALSAAFRGSKLHYNALAPLLAERMSPREFVEAVESGDAEKLSEIGEIGLDRARSVINHLKSQGTEEILTCQIEDGVRLSLLDGTEYKSTEHLSTGQRCTVILPLLLARHTDVLVVDQPEDHLDNAFIVDTLIKAILKRKSEGQLIFSTHNANIPVLGEANKVILLGSDGKRGFVRHAGQLDHPESVTAISSVMEGGKDAFKRRYEFYAKSRSSE